MNLNPKDFFQSNAISKIIGILAILLIILIIFQAGFIVGYHKGAFSSNWNRNYVMRGVNNPESSFAQLFHDNDDVNPHGVIGQIVSMDLPVIMNKGPGRAEEVVIINKDTIIRNFKDMATTSDLEIGKALIVIGEPNDKGEITASLIRIMPSPPSIMSSSTITR